VSSRVFLRLNLSRHCILLLIDRDSLRWNHRLRQTTVNAGCGRAANLPNAHLAPLPCVAPGTQTGTDRRLYRLPLLSIERRRSRPVRALTTSLARQYPRGRPSSPQSSTQGFACPARLGSPRATAAHAPPTRRVSEERSRLCVTHNQPIRPRRTLA